MPPENKTAAVRCRCTIIVLHKTLSIINTTLNTTYYVHFSWKQRQIHNPGAGLIVYVSRNLGCKPYSECLFKVEHCLMCNFYRNSRKQERVGSRQNNVV